MSVTKISALMLLAVTLSGCQVWQSDLDRKEAPSAISEPGVVYVEYWDNIEGVSVSDLTSAPGYPDNPDDTVSINSLDGPRERGSQYGARVRGFIEPPLAGEYRFFISSDDQSEFYLSSNVSEDNKELIASVTGWANAGVFDKYASQASGIIDLESDKRYYFEILFKERWGDDHFIVAWEGPGFARSIVPASALHSWAPPSELDDEAGMAVGEAYNLGYRVGYLDGEEGLDFNPEYPPEDDDGDGIYDNWEVVHGLDPNNPDDARSDPDGDFLSASQEFFLGTEEGNTDTDGDGIPDGEEFAMELDPLDPADAREDLDGDGYTNLQEYQAGTDIRSAEDMPEEPETAFVSGFVGQYFDGTGFDELIYVRLDDIVDFDWGRNSAPDGLPLDNFSVRWFSQFVPPHSSGTRDYRFTVSSDDGVRLYLDGDLVIDEWQGQAVTSFTHIASLPAGDPVAVTLEYFEGELDAAIQMSVIDLADGTGVNFTEAFRSPDPTSTSTMDTDNDGIPDTWELANGTNAWVADGGEVLNDQGVSNLEAYSSGLSPRTLEPAAGEPGILPDEEEETATGEGSVLLTWTAPSTRVDGESIALSEIDSYIVRYGQEETLDQQVEVDSADTSYQFSNLESGTWYFTVQVVDNSGLVSEPSEVVTHSVP
ncbi:PA14 domain-containing protein [Marinobacter sp. OP 3.4]|uniref:PA14 domain-containing protein n=1 Tax=Marinobacter sp. OP 3.4 TaxID=3076501 RepID=UPI002E1FA966